jgi:hypothetical protein
MALFRKKPVVIEAWCNTDEPRHRSNMPSWLRSGVAQGLIQFSGVYRGHATIKTLEGTMIADYGDWIIRGIRGELYPIKPDIFAATYEPAEPPSDQSESNQPETVPASRTFEA